MCCKILKNNCFLFIVSSKFLAELFITAIMI